MLVPVGWLRDYVDIDIETSTLAEKLNQSGIHIEEVIKPQFEISGVAAGKIVSLEKHPDAVKLLIAKVNIGKETLQIVTGAQNVKTNDLVPVAKIGANLYGNLKIKKASLRGVESFGMMCSSKELGFEMKSLPSEQQEGVLILNEIITPGEDLVKLFELNDEVFKFETFANRPDCLSILGIAYESAGVLSKKIKQPSVDFKEFDLTCREYIKVEIENLKDCPRYLARVIKDVEIKPSDLKISLRLIRAGFRPINNVVDFTNYVMAETGHPLHAFDYNLIDGKKIIVRLAKDKEVIVTLDQNKRQLDSSVLVIADAEKPVALAGIMGGYDSEINENTSDILLESALFDPALIRRASFKLGLISQSSKRFEKQGNFYQVKLASDRFLSLISKESGKILKDSEDIKTSPPPITKINLPLHKPAELLGLNISPDVIKEKLSNLGFKAVKEGNLLKIEVPSYRIDIKEAIDIIEEIARLTGYDNIPETLPKGLTTYGQKDKKDKFLDNVKQMLKGAGLTEVITYSLIGRETLTKAKLNIDTAVSVLNPLTQDQQYCRSSIMPQLLKVIEYNLKMDNKNMSVFEIGQIWDLNKNKAREKESLAIALTGELFSKEVNFYLLKGAIEQLFSKLRIKFDLIEESFSIFHPNISCKILGNDKILGRAGRIHPEVLDSFDINADVYAAEIDMGALLHESKEKIFKEFSRFPKAARDISLIVAENIKSAQIEDVILTEGRPLLKEVLCFDVYKGKQVPEGYKSLAYSLIYQSEEKTLTEEEVSQKHDKIISALKSKLNAQVRMV